METKRSNNKPLVIFFLLSYLLARICPAKTSDENERIKCQPGSWSNLDHVACSPVVCRPGL